MRLLITGGHGFIGQHLAVELADHGHDVIPVDMHDGGDLREPDSVVRLLEDHRPDRVVHLAARVGRLFGEDDRVVTVTSNALATVLVANEAGDRGIPVVYASTSEVYGDLGETIATEAGPCRLPHNLYGLSKRWGEEALRLYAPDRLLLLRLSMPYGPGHPPGRGRAALTNILHQALHDLPIPIHDGSERSWCWVGDTVRAVRLLIEGGHQGVWNIGRDDNAVPMVEVARRACALVGADPALIRLVPAPSRQTVVKRLGMAKLRSYTGWQPEVDLDEGMRRVLAYVREFDREGKRVEAETAVRAA